jgi:hypothetical protein
MRVPREVTAGHDAGMAKKKKRKRRIRIETMLDAHAWMPKTARTQGE